MGKKVVKIGDALAAREGATIVTLNAAAWSRLTAAVDLERCGLVLAHRASSRMLILPASLAKLPFADLLKRLRQEGRG